MILCSLQLASMSGDELTKMYSRILDGGLGITKTDLEHMLSSRNPFDLTPETGASFVKVQEGLTIIKQRVTLLPDAKAIEDKMLSLVEKRLTDQEVKKESGDAIKREVQNDPRFQTKILRNDHWRGVVSYDEKTKSFVLKRYEEGAPVWTREFPLSGKVEEISEPNGVPQWIPMKGEAKVPRTYRLWFIDRYGGDTVTRDERVLSHDGKVSAEILNRYTFWKDRPEDRSIHPGQSDGQVIVRDMSTGQVRLWINSGDRISHIGLNADGTRLFFTYRERIALFWSRPRLMSIEIGSTAWPMENGPIKIDPSKGLKLFSTIANTSFKETFVGIEKGTFKVMSMDLGGKSKIYAADAICKGCRPYRVNFSQDGRHIVVLNQIKQRKGRDQFLGLVYNAESTELVGVFGGESGDMPGAIYGVDVDAGYVFADVPFTKQMTGYVIFHPDRFQGMLQKQKSGELE